MCQSFDLTPTFAKVTSTKSEKWRQSAKSYEQNVITEELSEKRKQISFHKEEVNEIFDEIRNNCSTLCYICILKTVVKNSSQMYNLIMKVHTNKISRLSFFPKLALCRGLQFAFPTRINDKEVLASFERTYRVLEPNLVDEKNNLTAATLRSIALNYIERKGPSPPRSLRRALGQLRKRDDIVVTKPDKGTGVVVMDKSQYTKLLNEASIDNKEKFRSVNLERPKTRGRPPKHYHPLLQKEKELETVVRQILPKEVADAICPKGSRLAHLYGLPKTHKPKLAMRPILSATGTYNFMIAKWLDEKLKPISINEFTVSDPLRFSEELRKKVIVDGEILVSYDVSSLFTNVPVDETIEILVEKAFHKEWFNYKYNLGLKESDLRALLNIAVKNQLFQLDGKLYEQTDGVAMGSPLGPLMANTFMCSIEEKLVNNMDMPSFYHRFVDDTITSQRSLATAEDFLDTLNSCHESLNFTMECEVDGKLPFLGMEAIRNDDHLETKVYVKPTNTGLLLHYQSHVDRRYKRSLITTMLNRAFRLSSSWEHFVEECERLKNIFVHLKYPLGLVDSVISGFVDKQYEEVKETSTKQQENVVCLILPFKDQKSADIVRRQLTGLGSLIGKALRPVFTSRNSR